jgi:hypothetical protein
MKTLILAGALAFTSFATLANPTPAATATKTLHYQATQNLYALYGQLENVEWRNSINNMIRADFVEDETSYAIFFSAEGEFLAETKKVTRTDLPLALRKSTDQKFKELTLIESLELTNSDEHVWFFKTEAEGKTIIWKGYQTGSIELYSKK